MIVYFDEDTCGTDIIQELNALSDGKIWFKKHVIENVTWYFFSDSPLTTNIIEKTLNIYQSNCRHDWTDANGKCEDCGYQGPEK